LKPPAQYLLLLLGRQERSQRPGQETASSGNEEENGGYRWAPNQNPRGNKATQNRVLDLRVFFEREERPREERERFVRGEADGGKGKASAAAPEETRRRRRQG
jgi:hypothetical protein